MTRNKTLRALTAAAMAGLAISAATTASADVVTEWNELTLNAIRESNSPPPVATRALAIVHLAIFDAVNGIEEEYEPYLITREAPDDALPEAAVIAAAHQALVRLYPELRQQFNQAALAQLDSIPRGPERNQGLAWGAYCGRRMFHLRRHDGSDEVVEYEPSGIFGRWQPTPPGFAPALLPQWQFVEPFAMITGDQFRAPATPEFTSQEYAEAFNEVKELGSIDSLTRTEDETLIAYFWEDGPTTCTPPGHWQVIAQQLSHQHGATLVENARLFALLSIAQADGAISAWDSKYHHDHVRPYTAITEEADLDGNPDTQADPNWFNLIPTPPFPAYTSGHSTFSGCSSKMLELYFGRDEIEFCGVSPDPERWPDVLPGVERCWDSLSEAAEEAGMSRIYGGIHWQYDNVEGLVAGRDLAEYVFFNFLRPK